MPVGAKSASLYRMKFVRPEIKVLDEDEGLVSAVVSTEAQDRDKDRIIQRFWNLENFNRHPVLLASHDYRSLRSQIGTWEEMAVKGKKLVGVARYFIGQGNEEADWGFKLAQQHQAAYSVGFMPDMTKAVPLNDKGEPLEEGTDAGFFTGPVEFRGQELLEVSHVTIPSNPEALQRMKGVHPVLDEIVAELTKDVPRGKQMDMDDLGDKMDAMHKKMDRMMDMMKSMSDMKALEQDAEFRGELTALIREAIDSEVKEDIHA